MKTKLFLALAAIAASTAASNAQGELRVTEVLYTALYGEFFEVTNVAPNAGGGANDVDVTGYTFIDAAATPVPVTFPAINLEPGKSIVFTEADPTIFDLAWYTLPFSNVYTPPASLAAVRANVTQNLGRTDKIVLRDSLVTIVETLNFTDQNSETVFPTPGPDYRKDVGVRSEEISAVPAVLPGNPIPDNRFSTWLLSNGRNAANVNVGLPAGSATPWESGNPAGNGSLGSPGVYVR